MHGGDVGSLEGVVRSHRPQRWPVVLTEYEVRRVLSKLQGTPALVAQILYGSGLRLIEALCLRIKDGDFEKKNYIVVWDGKGDEDRITMLPEIPKVPLRSHLTNVYTLHQKDLWDATTWMPARYRKRCVQQRKQQASTSPQSVTHYVILLQPSYWSEATLSVRSRSCLVIAM